MSEEERLAPMAGGDASVIEAIKINHVDKPQSLTADKSECTDIMSGNAATIAKEDITTLNTQTKIECPVNLNSANALTEEAANFSACNVKAQITAEAIAKDPTEDAFDEQRPITETTNSTAMVPQEVISQSVDEEKIDKSKESAMQAKDDMISKLEAEMQKKTKERDSYRKKLENTEKKLATLQAAYNALANHDDKNSLQQSLEQLQGQLVQTALMYEERNRVVANQENQINALNNQVTSLKEVISITRDLLEIRNMEVKQLQAEVDNMEKKIAEERDRHNAMISKMDAAMRLNADLKKEYETQLSLFQSLREKYGEKITLLSEEKRALQMAASTPE